MANQNPQPDIYEINLSFANSSAQGTKISSQVYTFQSSFEEVRVYAVMVNIVNSEDDDASASMSDFQLTIEAGANKVPSNSFDIGAIATSREKTLALPSPVVVGFQEPLTITGEWMGTTNLGAATVVKITLIAETAMIEGGF